MPTQPSPPEEQSAPADVLIVTALREERDAVKAVTTGALGKWTETRAPSTELRIERRSFRAVNGGMVHVALICNEEMGGAQTVGVAGPAIMALQPRCLAMCGVLAGKPNDTEFGDVVFADQLLTHDTGKRTESRFEHATRPHTLDIRWLEKARDFAENPGDALAWLARSPWTPTQQRAWLLDQFSRGFNPRDHQALLDECCPSYDALIQELVTEGLVQPRVDDPLTEKGKAYVNTERFQNPKWPGLDPPRRSTRVQVAPMAAGNAVQADPALWEELSTFARKVLGVEMESYAVGTAAELHGIELALIMKGVMDHANRDKDDRFKSFAARASAECLIAFLRKYVAGNATRTLPKPETPKPELHPFSRFARSLWRAVTTVSTVVAVFAAIAYYFSLVAIIGESLRRTGNLNKGSWLAVPVLAAAGTAVTIRLLLVPFRVAMWMRRNWTKFGDFFAAIIVILIGIVGGWAAMLIMALAIGIAERYGLLPARLP